MNASDARLASPDSIWAELSQLPEPDAALARLALLRALHHRAHAELSRINATALPFPVVRLERALEQASKLLAAGQLAGALDARWPEALRSMLQSEPDDNVDDSCNPGLAALPSELAQRLERPDFAWERAMATRALSAGWQFIELRSRVPMKRTLSFHEALESALWPRGLVLWCRSVETEGAPLRRGLWRGSWLVCTPLTPNALRTIAQRTAHENGAKLEGCASVGTGCASSTT